MAEEKEPRYRIGQTVRHLIWGDVTISGIRREHDLIYYDLFPSLNGGELRTADGKYYTPELMLYEPGEPPPKAQIFSGEALS